MAKRQRPFTLKEVEALERKTGIHLHHLAVFMEIICVELKEKRHLALDADVRQTFHNRGADVMDEDPRGNPEQEFWEAFFFATVAVLVAYSLGKLVGMFSNGS